MAITILNKPTSPNVTGTKLVYSVSSSNATQPQFNYVTDIYPSGSSDLLTRLFSYPNLNGSGIVDVARVLDDSITYDHNFFEASSSYSDLYGKFEIKFGEAYGTSPSSSITIYDSLTTDEIEVFPGIVDANSGSFNFPSSSYIPTAGTAGDKVIDLSDVPIYRGPFTSIRETQAVEEDQYLTYSVLKNNYYIRYSSSPVDSFEVFIFYGHPSVPNSFDFWRIPTTAGTEPNQTGIINLAAGPANLKQLSTVSSYFGDTFTQAFSQDWVLVSVNIRGNIGNPPTVNSTVFTSIYYNPNAPLNNLQAWLSGPIPSQFESRFNKFRYCNTPTRFAFINNSGGWDYYNVYAPLKKSTNVSRNIYDENYVDYSSNTSIYSGPNRGETQYLTQYTDNYEIVTPYVGEKEAGFITSLIDSRDAFVQVGDKFIPIVITNTSYDWNMNENRQKLFQYTIQYRYANQRYTR